LETVTAIMAAPVVADLYALALSSCIGGGLYMEFGVAAGRSLREIRKRLPESIRLYGFDSFYGLPEPWGEFPRGAFATGYRITLPNTLLVEGRFEETLPAFAARHRLEHVSFMHIDCDLYSSTKVALEAFADRIVAGTVILFDEVFGFAGFELHEYRALTEFARERNFETIGRWNSHRAAVRVLS
jgi:methyltransferase family protein